MSVIQDLYNSEINFAVSTMWDGGFEVQIGDQVSGFKAKATFWHWGQVEQWLTAEAIKHWPMSDFAMIYRDGKDKWEIRREREPAKAVQEVL